LPREERSGVRHVEVRIENGGAAVKAPVFEYHAPTSLEEALALLAEHGDEAKVLAGGQSLIPLLVMRLARPAQLIDLNGIESLGGLDDRGDHLAFGAMVRERTAERSPVVREKAPLLAEALPFIGHVAIRNRGTIGGSIAHADASAELPAVAVATGAEVLVRSVRGERTLPAEDFFQGHFTTALADDECLVEVRVPASPAGAGWSFQEVASRPGDFALVGVAAMIALDPSGSIRDSRISLLGVASQPVRARSAEEGLQGARPTAEAFEAAAHEATVGLKPSSDLHASHLVRRHLASVTVRRALTTAARRAGASL
jgi:aerobic carbon-monoxide dehydrogenase medium subunit